MTAPAVKRSPRPYGARSRTGSGVSAIYLALVLMGALPADSSAQINVDSVPVRDLTFEGNEAFRGSALREAILTEDTHCRSPLLSPFCWLGGDWAIEHRTLDRPEMARDMARIRLFYFRRGYREATVDTSVVEVDGRAAVTFHIDEGRPVLVTQVVVREPGGTADLEAADDLPTAPGSPLSQLLLESSREALLTRLRNLGHAHAEVFVGFDIPAETPFSATVRFDLMPGSVATYGTITFQGLSDLDTATVRRLMPLEEGEVFTERALAQAQRNIFELDIVRHAEILTDLAHVPDSVVPLDVRVNEADPHRVRLGGGMSTFECLTAEGRWTSRNFRGGGRRLDLSVRLWNGLADELAESICNQAGTGVYGRTNYRISADFLQPVVGSPQNSFSSRVFFERESFPQLFVRQTVGTDLLFSRNIGRLSATGLFYRPQYGSFEAAEVYFCSNFLICDAEEIAIVSEPNMLAPVGIALSTDRTNPVFDPVGGWTGLITFEKAGTFTASDYAYERIIVEGSTFVELGRRTQRVIGARLRVGLLNPRAFGGVTTELTDVELTAPQKRFYSGGATSVRGFSTGRLGPRSLQTDVRNLVPDTTRAERSICEPEEILDLTCDANDLPDGGWTEGPTGGNLVLVGNVEYRGWLAEKLQAVVYLDFGQVWSERGDVKLADLEFTPGIGVRYPTPIGPLRLDLAYNFRKTEFLPSITSQLELFDPNLHNADDIVSKGSDGTEYVVSVALAPLIPAVGFGSDDLWSLSRFQIHFSIGQAF